MPGKDGALALLTEVQYGSSAGMWRSSASRKMPFLKTNFESLAPISASKMGYQLMKGWNAKRDS